MASYRRDVAPMTGTMDTSDTGGNQDITRVEPSGFTQAEPANKRGDDRDEGYLNPIREAGAANPEAMISAITPTQDLVAEREDLPEGHRPNESEYAPRLDEVGAYGTMVARQQPSSVGMVTHHTASAAPLDVAYDPNVPGGHGEPAQAAGGGIIDPRTTPQSTEEAAERREVQNERAIESGSETAELGEGGEATTSQEVYDEFDQESEAGNLATSTDNHEQMATEVKSSPDDQPMGDKHVEAPAGGPDEPAQVGPVDAGSDEGSQDDQTDDEATSEAVSEVERPSKSDRKEEWLDYAKHLGVETTFEDEDGETKTKTKDDLIADIEAHEAEQTSDEDTETSEDDEG